MYTPPSDRNVYPSALQPAARDFYFGAKPAAMAQTEPLAATAAASKLGPLAMAVAAMLPSAMASASGKSDDQGAP